MAESTLYLHPATGELTDAPTGGAVRLPGAFTVGVTAPVVLFCKIHGRAEAHGMVAALGMRDREAAGPLAFARALLAAGSHTCGQYRQWARGFRRGLAEIVARGGRASAPSRSWSAYIALINARTSFHDALRALAHLPVPAAPRSVPTQPLALDRRSGEIHVVRGRRAEPDWQSLPSGPTAWLIAPCADHGAELFDTLPFLTRGSARTLLEDLATSLAAEGAASCDEFARRLAALREETSGFADPLRASPVDATETLRFCVALAGAIVRVSDDLGWLVAHALVDLAGGA
jgi:hypothetical protein